MSVDKLVDSTQLNADLTSVANVIRAKGGTSAQLAFPEGFVQAIRDIPTGGGGSGIEIGVATTPIPNILNMFAALESGTAKTGEFTLATALPNTETLVFSSGLTAIQGIFIADETQETVNTANTPENVLFTFGFFNTGAVVYAATKVTGGMVDATTSVTRVFGGTRATFRVDGGDLYATANFNKKDEYTPFHSGHTYRWVAW